MSVCPLCNGSGDFEFRDPNLDIKKQIELLITHGVSYQHTADRLGLHKSTVGYYVKRYGLSQLRHDAITNRETIDALAERNLI